MVNRPAGGPRSKKWERAPNDWYREGPAPVEQLMHGVDFARDLIWDPCCGAGNVLDVAKRYGHHTFGSDVIARGAGIVHHFELISALTVAELPYFVRFNWLRGSPVSIITNTPYSYEPLIAERIIANLLDRLGGHVRRFAFIVPIAFLAGQERWRDNCFHGRWRPSHTAIYRERHTMPPGHLIDQMARPYEGGMADYAVVVFTPPHRWRTETVWLSPGRFPDPPARAQPEREKASG